MSTEIAIPLVRKDFDGIYRAEEQLFVNIESVPFEVNGFIAYATCGDRVFPRILKYLERRGRLFYIDGEPFEPLTLRSTLSGMLTTVREFVTTCVQAFRKPRPSKQRIS